MIVKSSKEISLNCPIFVIGQGELSVADTSLSNLYDLQHPLFEADESNSTGKLTFSNTTISNCNTSSSLNGLFMSNTLNTNISLDGLPFTSCSSDSLIYLPAESQPANAEELLLSVTLANLKISSCSGTVLTLSQSSVSVQLENCTIDNCDRIASLSYTTLSPGTFTAKNCTLTTCTPTADSVVSLLNISGASVTNCTFSGSTKILDCHSVSTSSITECTFSSCSETINYQSLINSSITDCNFTVCSHMITCNTITNSSITECTFSGCTNAIDYDSITDSSITETSFSDCINTLDCNSVSTSSTTKCTFTNSSHIIKFMISPQIKSNNNCKHSNVNNHGHNI